MYQILKSKLNYDFNFIWNNHPAEHLKVKMYDKLVSVPRWVQAYGRDYAYSGQIAKSKEIPDWLTPFFEEIKQYSPSVNGVLVNWYDGSLKHKIGPHRDNESELVEGSDIITVSLGEDRVFRFRKFKAKEPPIDQIVSDKEILIIPWKTNVSYTHEVPHFAKYTGKRISLTFRTFLNE